MTLISNLPTTTGNWALLLSRVIESYGVRAQSLFAAADLDLAEIENNPEHRVAVGKMAKVWQDAVEKTADPCIALTMAHYFQPNAYSAVGVALASSRTIQEAMERSINYYSLTSDVANIELFTDHHLVISLSIPPENQPCAVEAIEAYFTTAIRLFRQMLQLEFPAHSVSFSHSAKKQKAERFNQYFGCHVEFAASRNELVIHESFAKKPQILSNPSLIEVLESWMEEQLALYSKQSLSKQVQNILLQKLLLTDVDAAIVADELGIGIRTMQRRLRQEGSNFQALLRQSRQHLAEKLVSSRDLPLSEIALVLGFSDQSSFSRAFREWTGMSPKSFSAKHPPSNHNPEDQNNS